MKKTLCILLAAAALWSCSSIDEPAPDAGAGLRVSVSDQGFTAGARTSDEGFVTNFTDGDIVAVYQLVNGKINYSSLYEAKVGESGEVAWISQTNTVISNIPGAKYFACYPGDKVEAGILRPDATDAGSFFADAVKGWKVDEDQSIPENYSASDLMYAEGVVSGEELSFGMTHAMALVNVKLPSKKYVFTNEPKIPDYTLWQPSEASFSGVIPRQDPTLGYLWLINPADGESAEVSGYYYNGTAKRQWSATASPKAGKVSSFNIDPAENEVRSHRLQIGDFFLSDGSLLSKDATREEIGAAYIVGVVYNIDPDRIGEAEKLHLNGNVHGSVLATKDIYKPYNLMCWSASQLDEKEIGLKDIMGSTTEQSYELANADISGLGRLQMLKSGRTDEYALDDKYVAFKFAESYGNDMPDNDKLRAATTGWYLPAIGQWFDIVRGLCDTSLAVGGILGPSDLFYWKGKGSLVANFNKYMEKIPESMKTEMPQNRYFWTASAAQPLYAYYVNITDGVQGVNSFSCFANNKTSFSYARAVLVF